MGNSSTSDHEIGPAMVDIACVALDLDLVLSEVSHLYSWSAFATSLPPVVAGSLIWGYLWLSCTTHTLHAPFQISIPIIEPWVLWVPLQPSLVSSASCFPYCLFWIAIFMWQNGHNYETLTLTPGTFFIEALLKSLEYHTEISGIHTRSCYHRQKYSICIWTPKVVVAVGAKM